MAKQAILTEKKLLESIKSSNNGDVVTLEHITAVMSKEKLMCMAQADAVLKFDYAKVYSNDTTGYDSVYIYFKDSKRKQYSMSLSEMNNCMVKESTQGTPVEMISYLEERFSEGKSFPEYISVYGVLSHEKDDQVYPLAYYKEYTRASWTAHSEKYKGDERSIIRSKYLDGKTLKAKFADKPFLKSITFEVLD